MYYLADIQVNAFYVAIYVGIHCKWLLPTHAINMFAGHNVSKVLLYCIAIGYLLGICFYRYSSFKLTTECMVGYIAIYPSNWAIYIFC